MVHELERIPSFGRYSNPALDCRIANDLQRSQSRIANNLPRSPHLSPHLSQHLSISAKCVNIDDLDPTPLTLRNPIAAAGDMGINNGVVINSCDVTREADDDTEKHRILLVDDSPLNLKMLSKLLKSKGYNVEEAADGQIAVDKVKGEYDAGRSYDVILMDFVMPVMDGPTATRAIRAMGVISPVFGLTGKLG